MSDLLPDREFQAHLDEGRFMLQRVRGGGAPFHFPRVMEPGTGRGDLEWVEADGRGTVYATTVVRAKPPAQAYNLALVDLVEGPRVTCRVVGLPPEQVTIGLRVRASIDRSVQPALLVFEPDKLAGQP